MHDGTAERESEMIERNSKFLSNYDSKIYLGAPGNKKGLRFSAPTFNPHDRRILCSITQHKYPSHPHIASNQYAVHAEETKRP